MNVTAPEIELAYLGSRSPTRGARRRSSATSSASSPASRPAGALTWRDDEGPADHRRSAGPANDAVSVGFEAADAAAFDATVDRLGASAPTSPRGPTTTGAGARVDRLVRTTAPWGVAVELVLGLADAPTPFASPLCPAGSSPRASVRPRRVRHHRLRRVHRFLTDGLGFAQSDWLETELAPGIELEVRFFHCNPRHHTVALGHGAVRAAAEAAPRDVRDERPRRRRRRVRPGVGDRPADPERPRPARQRRDVQLLRRRRPAGFQVEVGHGARIIDRRLGPTTAATTASASGATSRCSAAEGIPSMKIANCNGRAVLVLGDEIADVADRVRRRVRPRPDERLRRLGRVRDVRRRRRHRHRRRSSRPQLRLPGAGAAAGVRHRPELPQPRRGVGHGRCPSVPATFTKFPASPHRPVRRHRARRAPPSTGRSSSSP